MEEQKIEEMWKEFKTILLNTKRKGIENIINWLENETDFKTAPASTQYHSSIKGGLLYHSLQVYYHMYDFNNLLQIFDLSNETVAITALLHDVCKTNTYDVSYRNTKNEEGNWIKVPYYTVNESIPYGHGEKSVMLLQYYGLELSLIEIMMIRSHMGAFRDNQQIPEVSKRFSICPQSIVLHFADMLSTYTTESNDLQKRFKDKINGRNVNEWLENLNKPKTINIGGTEYLLAPEDAIVDNEKIVEKIVNPDGTDKFIKVKVYTPYGDGLPF